MIYGSVCSGIEAATVAWHPLGWRPSFFAEIERFPRAVLAHHWPVVPIHGDFTTIQADDYEPIDLLVGGTPCQDFSVAGLRAGMAGDRGNLTLQFLTLARRLRPKWVVWENVPGVLSSNGGRDFGSFLGGLGELGYGWAYRTLDAQYFGVPQRRRRVFVVGYLGDWRRASAVLFERHSLQGHPSPRREAGAHVARCIDAGSGRRRGSGIQPNALTVGTLGGASDKAGWRIGPDEAAAGFLIPDTATALRARDGKGSPDSDCTSTLLAFGGNNTRGPIEVSTALNACHTASGRMDFETETFIAHTLRGNGFDASEDGTGRGTPLVPAVSFNWQAGGTQTSLGYDPDSEVTGALHVGQTPAIAGNGVRRLTPRECERLQGFPDDYTRIPVKILKRMPKTKHFQRYPDLYGRNDDGTWTKYAADGPRYKALGNSMAVPVMRWIGERIAMVETLP